MTGIMNSVSERREIILVLEDIDETRYLLEQMLKGDGYYVDLARDEEDAIVRARSQPPDLILMSLGLEREQLVETALRIRQATALGPEVPVVIFCVPSIPAGAEIEVHKNIYVTRPDNFDQLRKFLRWLLGRFPSA
jgi:CheY-like chemotaxis protein